ncbi:MAG: carboxypeptidase-like regulatory domain-containing protein [Planctomycetes bacterium]|nr:carboxypeptidase-like regulatory domain-containing protein [Planctomycetota bacterium]
MHAPPRLALLAALGLIAIFPSLPLGGSVAAGDSPDEHLFPLNIHPVLPAHQHDLELELCLVQPNEAWTGAIAEYHPDQPLLLPRLRSSVEVLLRSRDGLWAARATLGTHPSQEPLSLPLKPRGILSGVVLSADGAPMHCLVQAKGADGVTHTVATSDDGTFRFAWLPEGRYQVMSPLTVDGRCRQEVLAIAGQEVHFQLEPKPTQGPETEIIGQVQSSSGEYCESLKVKLWPLDLEAAPAQANVQWTGQGGAMEGSFKIPATVGERYVVALEKADVLPTFYNHAPISAPSQISIFCEDDAPHAELVIKPQIEGTTSPAEPFEVAITWDEQVIWRDSLDGEVRIEGAPVDRPIHWMVRASGAAPAYGELTLNQPNTLRRLAPALSAGWGEGLRLTLPDGAPASHVAVYLDGELAGHTDSEGTLTLKSDARPSFLSIDAAHLRMFGGVSTTQKLDSLRDRDDLGRLLLVLLPRD